MVLLGAAIVLGCTPKKESKEVAKQDDRPNILLIMADDLGYSDLGCYGGEINTPHLNLLAENGIRFTQFYNNARCTPTRASLISGLYPHQTGIGAMNKDLGLKGYRGDLNGQSVTIAEVLKGAGYHTYLSGKWHLTAFMDGDQKHNWPLQRGFDKFYGSLDGFGGSGYYHTKTLTKDNRLLPVPSEDFYYTDAVTDSVIAMLKTHRREASNPFFMYLAYSAPHWPLHALEEDIKKYDTAYDKGWDRLRQNRLHNLIEEELLDKEAKLSEKESDVPEWSQAENKLWEASRMQVHAAMVDRMDQGIGRIITMLKEQKLLDNTLIFFLSDNGASAEDIVNHGWWKQNIPTATPDGRKIHRFNLPSIIPGADTTYLSVGKSWASASNAPFRYYKRFLHEGGIASPLIVHWPKGIKTKNEKREQVSHVIDLMATCIDVAKAEYPKQFNGQTIIPMEGVSLKPMFNEDVEIERTLFWEHLGRKAVRKGKYKIVTSDRGDNARLELYNMELDRTETNNIIDQYPNIAEKLRSEWESWAVRTNAKPWPWKDE